jgi:octaprenyl-diphosphate synthase
MAFQIRDDILDFEGRAGILGKPVGADLKGKKITLPLIYALQHSEDGRRGKILNAIKRHQNLKEVITFVRKSEGLHYSRTRAQDFVNSAQKRLDAFPPNPAKDLLCQLADYSINRNS